MKKSTMELLKLIEKTPTFKEYESQAEGEFIEKLPLHVYLKRLLKAKDIEQKEVTRRSGMDRKYVHNIFSGARKNPSRDKVLTLCLAMGLSADETQELLKCTGYPSLYPRIKRDSAIIYAMERRMSVKDTEELLDELGESSLDQQAK